MTVWGGWNNHLRVGLDIWTDPISHGTTQTTLHVQTTVQCDSSWNFNDSQTVTLYVNGGVSATWNFQDTLGPNGTVTFLQDYPEYPSYGGGPGWTFQSNLTGNYLGGTSSVSQGYTLPARPIAAPSPPGAPDYNTITAQTGRVTWGFPGDVGGANPDASWLQLATANFANVVYDNQQSGWGGRNVGGLAPNTTYYGRAAAHNPAGWSGWSGVTAFTTNAYQLAAPTLSSVAATSATVSWGNPPTSDTPTQYTLQVATDAGFTKLFGSYTAAWTKSRAVTGLIPGTTYYYRVRASTSSGWGVYSPAVSSKTLSGAKVRQAGAWKDAVAFVRVGGVWKQATVNKRVGGVWKL